MSVALLGLALVAFALDWGAALALFVLGALNLNRAIYQLEAIGKTAVIARLGIRDLIEDLEALAPLLGVVAQQVNVVGVRQVGDVAQVLAMGRARAMVQLTIPQVAAIVRALSINLL